MLDKLTGVPTEEDTCLFAIPMSAPYSMVVNHTYKCKLQPGPLKRGKAKKNIKDLFLSMAKNSKYYDLVRGMTDQEMMDPIPTGVKVLAPGIGKLQQNNKKNRKKQK